MNELGKEDVDGRILNEETNISVEKLLDGCVCCSKKEELAECLQLLLQKQPDVLFIELTGVANPEEIAIALSEPALQGRIREQQVITLVDAEHALEYNSIFSADRQLVQTLRRQIAAADLLIVNKTDLVHPKKLEKVTKAIRKQNERAKMVHAVQCQIDIAPLLAASVPNTDRRSEAPWPILNEASRSAEKRHEHQPEHQHEHTRDATPHSYSQVQTFTLSLPSDQPIDKEMVEQFMLNRQERFIRVKGYVRVKGKEGLELLQYAGNRVSWTPSAYPGSPYLVFIGLNLNEKLLAAEWSKHIQSASLS